MHLTLERKINVGFAITLLILLLAGLVVWTLAGRLGATMRRTDHSRDVLIQIEDADTGLLEMQDGFRGFMLSGLETSLDPYRQAASGTAATLGRLRRITSDNPRHQKRLDRIDPLLAETAARMEKRIGERRVQGMAAASPVGNRQLILQLRGILSEMRQDEQGLLEHRSRKVEAALRTTIAGVAVLGALAVAALIAAAAMLQRDLAASRVATAEIKDLNANLSLQNLRLEEANHELEAFSYSVSHDLRAPLRHIDAFASLLDKHPAAVWDEKGRHYLQTISQAAQRMGRLIDDLLDFSRMGRAHMAVAKVDSDALVAGLVRDFDAARQGPAIDWRISALPQAPADLAMLRQVWTNLIDNAVKYSGRSPSPRIEISGSLDIASNEFVFCVRDNGVGFDMKYAAQLFRVFKRLHSSDEFKGTGIGLALVRRIIMRHGGRTWAEGRVGEGARIYFSLPARKTSPIASACPA